MLWIVAFSALATLIIPPIVLWAEAARLRAGPQDVGFWALARTVSGTCHTRWGRQRSPIIRFPLPDAEGRVQALRWPGRRGWTIEARAYQEAPFDFAARISSPPTPPARWRSPGLQVVEAYPEDAMYLPDASLEATDERCLGQVLKVVALRSALDVLLDAAGAGGVEVVLAGRVVVVRVEAPRDLGAGAAIERMGPQVVEVLRHLSVDLNQIAAANRDVPDDEVMGAGCPGCGASLDEDPWQCPGCGMRQHRGCRELLGGCVNVRCALAADAPAQGVDLRRERGFAS